MPIHIKDNIYRIFFSARNSENKSSVGAVDVDVKKNHVIQELDDSVFSFGPENSFYSHGVSIGNCFECQGEKIILFMGWKNEAEKHWYGQIGALILEDDFSLRLMSDSPFLSLDDEDPISLSYPWVLYHKGKYRMWYGSTTTWDGGNSEMVHVIKYAESQDGKSWKKCGQAIESKLGVAQAFSRPTVHIDHDGRFHMWFSYRKGDGTPYRIGYSSSDDGMQWTFPTQDMGVSELGWDDDMVEYPFVLDTSHGVKMFYNGNGFGKTGFGVADMAVQENV